jgi:hypothetical protein
MGKGWKESREWASGSRDVVYFSEYIFLNNLDS